MMQAGRALLLALVGGLIAMAGAAAQKLPDEGVKIEAPPLPQGLKWHNSAPLTMQELKGKVVLLDFWEYTCINCIRTFPYLKTWHDKYKDKGLVILGVHTPEFQFAKVETNVVRAVKQFELKHPIVVDSDYQVWQAYGNRYWPAKYLIDKDGFVRYFHFGEGSYQSTEAQIQKLLREVNPNVELPSLGDVVRGADKPGAVCYPVTPELYLGYERGGHANTLGNPEGYQPGRLVTFRDPSKWEDGKVYAHGAWRNEAEALVSTRRLSAPADYIAIRYHSLEVNSVLRPENGKPLRVYVFQDGKPLARTDKGDDIKYDPKGRSYLVLNEPRMYHLVKNAKFGQRTLKLATAEPGMGIYSFTFVSCEKR